MGKKIFLSFIIVIVFFTGACKKYPDGPLISFQSKMYRLTGKYWDVDNFTVDGYDSTSYLKNKPFYGTYYFAKPEGDNNGSFIYTATIGMYSGSGQWFFNNNKKSITIGAGYSFNGNIGPYRLDDSIQKVTWDIMRLTVKELWLKGFYNGKEYFVKFK